jgi:hypothetical protein
MRKRKSFLLTIVAAEDESPMLCGRLKTIATGQTTSFCSADELKSLILSELASEKEELAEKTLPIQFSECPASSA